jgi:hypothetical protein
MVPLSSAIILEINQIEDAARGVRILKIEALEQIKACQR